MILNNETFEKVGSLLNIPVNAVEYHGATGGNVLFFVGMKDNTNDWLSGAALYVTEQFKIAKAERIKLTRGRYTKNYPLRRFTLPFIPSIKSPLN